MGKNKNPNLENIKESELIEYYDATYDVMLIAIRLLKLKDIQKRFDSLRKN